eukprot:5343668-Pleurochrysis_carterae.AAC.1
MGRELCRRPTCERGSRHTARVFELLLSKGPILLKTDVRAHVDSLGRGMRRGRNTRSNEA